MIGTDKIFMSHRQLHAKTITSACPQILEDTDFKSMPNIQNKPDLTQNEWLGELDWLMGGSACGSLEFRSTCA